MRRTAMERSASGTRWQPGRHLLGWVPVLAILLLVHANNVVTAEQASRATESATVLQFDGTDDRITVPYDDSFPTEVFTASAWIKLSQPSRRAAIIARGEDDNSFNLSWQLYVTSDGTLETMLEDDRENNYCYPLNNCAPLGTCNVVGDLFVADNAWHHVAVARDNAGALSLYIDGEARASCEGTGVPSSNNFQDLSVGCTFGTIGPPPGGVEPPIWFFPGIIDEPAMWNLALSDAQIKELFSSGVDPLSSGLVGYWNFNEGTGQVTADLSSAENNGFLGEFPEPDNADPVWVDVQTSRFAHVTVAGGYSTIITIVNTGDTTADGDLILTHRSGDPFSVIMEAGLPSESGTGQRFFAEGSSFPVSIPSGGSVFMTATAIDPSGQAESGWARVEYSGGSLHGVSTFQLVENSLLQTIAGVLASQPQDAVTIPVDNDATQNRFTGFAVANFTGDDINLRLVTLDENGTITDSVSPEDLNPLGAQQQVAKFLHEYIPSKQTFRGTMVLMTEGGEQFVAAALIVNQALLTATPVIPGRVSSIPD